MADRVDNKLLVELAGIAREIRRTPENLSLEQYDYAKSVKEGLEKLLAELEEQDAGQA